MKQFLSAAFAMVLAVNVNAQSRLAGSWEGKMEVGGGIRLVLKVTESNGNLSATFDSPDQGATGIPISSVALNVDTVTFTINQPPVKYMGQLHDNTITGIWMQSGQQVPLEFTKTNKPAELDRPQTPKPPYIYKTEDVLFSNADKSITYGATITIPNTPGTKPAILLVTGSGPQNRDEEIAGHKPFAVIADYLTNKGYIVLRVDDRGVGQTTGDRTTATTADFINDANAAFDYLKSRKEVNTKKMGILGHSEGGMIAPALAVKRNDVDFIVMMAGPGTKIYELMEDQNAAIMESNGVSAGVVTDYRKLYRGMEQSIITGTSSDDARKKMTSVIDAWKKTADKASIELVGLTDNAKTTTYVDEFMKVYDSKWFNYFVKYDPVPVLQKLSCKVLAINGDKDIQVPAKPNLEGIRQALAKSKAKDVVVKELPGLNHLFQSCSTCTVQEYTTLKETISDSALSTIGGWLDKEVK